MVYGCEHHDQLLQLWRERDLRDIHLVHVDFHDDMRGLVIDRKRQVAYPTGALARGRAEADPGNFLAHAILDGRTKWMRWVHEIPRGRAWDAGIVGYESDWVGLPRRLRQRFSPACEVPLEFEEILLPDWRGLEDGERLSIDWTASPRSSSIATASRRGSRASSTSWPTKPPGQAWRSPATRSIWSVKASLCVKDLEDELIRAVGRFRIETVLEAKGELGSFHTLQKQRAWRDAPFDAQMRRFLGAGARRKLRYAQLLVLAVPGREGDDLRAAAQAEPALDSTAADGLRETTW